MAYYHYVDTIKRVITMSKLVPKTWYATQADLQKLKLIQEVVDCKSQTDTIRHCINTAYKALKTEFKKGA